MLRCGSNSVVECQLPKLKVAGSNPVFRSPRTYPIQPDFLILAIQEAFLCKTGFFFARCVRS